MVYGLWFRVRGKIGMRNEGSGFAASIYEAMPKVAFSHQSQVTSH